MMIGGATAPRLGMMTAASGTQRGLLLPTGCYGSWSWGDWWDYKNEPTTCQDFTTDAWTEAPTQPVRRVSLASGWRSEGDEAWDAPAEVTPPKGSPSEGPKKRWRRRRGNTHHDDDRHADQEAEQHSWKLKRDVWQARAPLAFIETAKDMSELLDSAVGVSILAWTSNAEVAHELGDLAAGERADADGADFSLTLLYEAMKLLGLLTVLRAQSVVMRFTADAAYGTIAWEELSKNPAKFAGIWASQHGVRQGDILDAYGYGFAKHGGSRLSGLMRIRSEAMARKLWAASGSLAAGAVFFADLTGEDFRDTIAAWARDTVMVQWQKWEPFKEYHSKVAKNAIPFNYGEVNDLLGDLGFSATTIHGRHKGRKSNEWTFKAVRADGQSMLQQHVDWGAGVQSDLVILKESARRGAHVDAKPAPRAETPQARCCGHFFPCRARSSFGCQQTSKGQKRAGPEDENKMNVDGGAANGSANAEHWSPAAMLFENPGGGNCLFYAMAQCGFENKAVEEVTHRQMRRFARRCLESFASDFEEVWKEGGAYNTLGRTTSDLTWQAFLDEVSASASWGGALELSAVARATSTRTWVYEKKDGSLRLIYPEGDGGFVLLQYDEEVDVTFIFRFRIVLLRQDGLGSRTVPLRVAAWLRLPLLVNLVATLRQRLARLQGEVPVTLAVPRLNFGLDLLTVLLLSRAQRGGRTKWECDCGFVVYEHPVIKSHHERRKLHLHKVHGVPWADIPPPPKPSHSASSAATQKAFEGRWQILWINANRWPGAHDISAESIGHPPKHRCKACQRLVKRSDVVSEVCTKHRFRSQVPALKARRKLWGSWSKAARKEATKQRGEARKTQRVADTRKAKVDSSQAFRARSTAGTSIDKPVVQIDLPLVKSSNRNTGNWWKCKYCEFAIPAFSPSRGRSSIKSRHLACGFCTASAMSLSRVAALRPFPPGLPMLRIPTNGDGASLGKLMQLPVGLAPTKSALPLRATASLPPALSESASGKPFAR
ncbi:unnamed protein product, partial [Symbiodinium sp. KB8]